MVFHCSGLEELQVNGADVCAKPKHVQIYICSIDCDTTIQTSNHPYRNLVVVKNSIFDKKAMFMPKTTTL